VSVSFVSIWSYLKLLGSLTLSASRTIADAVRRRPRTSTAAVGRAQRAHVTCQPDELDATLVKS
jgi:hypothetical protein